MKNEKLLHQLFEDFKKASPDWEDYCDNERDLIKECLLESTTVFEENCGSHRWWEDWFAVTYINKEIGYVGFEYAQANRDESMEDLGWTFDFDAVCRVEEYEKTVKAYRKTE